MSAHLSKLLHDPVDLLSLTRQPEAAQHPSQALVNGQACHAGFAVHPCMHDSNGEVLVVAQQLPKLCLVQLVVLSTQEGSNLSSSSSSGASDRLPDTDRGMTGSYPAIALSTSLPQVSKGQASPRVLYQHTEKEARAGGKQRLLRLASTAARHKLITKR